MRALDKSIYIVLCQFESKVIVKERDLSDAINRQTIVNQMVAGELDDVVQVWEFNPFEHWSNDISEDIAIELAGRIKAMMLDEIPADIRRFCEDHCGVATVLPAAA